MLKWREMIAKEFILSVKYRGYLTSDSDMIHRGGFTKQRKRKRYFMSKNLQ